MIWKRSLLVISKCAGLANFRLHFFILKQFIIKYSPLKQQGRFADLL